MARQATRSPRIGVYTLFVREGVKLFPGYAASGSGGALAFCRALSRAAASTPKIVRSAWSLAALTGLDDLRDRALMTVLVGAGLRKGEARNLCAGRCLLEARQLVVVGGKGGRDRVIPMGERLASVLADLFLTDGVEPDQFVWYGRGGNQHGHTRISRSRAIGEGTFHRWWERSLEGAGVRYRNPHTTRHTFATRWLRRGGRMDTSRRRWATPRSPRPSTSTDTLTLPT